MFGGCQIEGTSKNKRRDQSEKRQMRLRWGSALQLSRGRHSYRLVYPFDRSFGAVPEFLSGNVEAQVDPAYSQDSVTNVLWETQRVVPRANGASLEGGRGEEGDPSFSCPHGGMRDGASWFREGERS